MIKYKCIHKVGENMDATKVYDKQEFSDASVLYTLKKVSEILEERGYNPINQIVGYLLSGDLGYITSYNGARSMISEYDRSKLIEIILKKAL